MTRLLVLLLALVCVPAFALAGGDDDDDSAAVGDDDDSAAVSDPSDVPMENRVLGGGCDGQDSAGPYAALPFAGFVLGATRIRRRRDG